MCKGMLIKSVLIALSLSFAGVAAAEASGNHDVSVYTGDVASLDVTPCDDFILVETIAFESKINHDVVFNNVIDVDFIGRDERRPILTANHNQELTANIASVLDYEVGWRNAYTL